LIGSLGGGGGLWRGAAGSTACGGGEEKEGGLRTYRSRSGMGGVSIAKAMPGRGAGADFSLQMSTWKHYAFSNTGIGLLGVFIVVPRKARSTARQEEVSVWAQKNLK